jgi:hypothetical protein
MSRCVPYVDVTFMTGSPSLSKKSSPRLSLDRFLNVQINNSSETQLNTNYADNKSYSGMEIFTSPQTLVNLDDNDDGRTVPIINKTAPFLSLKSIDLDVVSAGAEFYSYKNGTIKLILHDRSRMSEISEFIRPDLYAKTDLYIEYGWSHPDPESGYGKFLNNLRVREKFGLTNSSFKFGNSGQVEIDLKIHVKGAVDYLSTKVGSSQKATDHWKLVVDLIEDIAKIKKTSEKKYKSNIFGEMALDFNSDMSSLAYADAETLSKYRKKLNTSNKELNAEEQALKDTILKLIGKNEKDPSAITEVKQTYSDVFKGLEVSVTNSESSSDGTDRDEPLTLGSGAGLYGESSRAENKSISFGKLLLLYLASPLQATEKFDDIQIITYPMNDNAGALRGGNLASFPVSKAEFKQNVKRMTEKKGHARVTIREFFKYIVNSFIDDPTNKAYGVSQFWKSDFDKESGEREVTQLSEEERDKKNIPSIEDVLKDYGITNGEFKMPSVQLHIEALPSITPTLNSDDPKTVSKGSTILRIHIYDKHCSENEMLKNILTSQEDYNVSKLKRNESKDGNSKEWTRAKHAARAKKIIGDAEKLGLLKTSGAGGKLVPSDEGFNDELIMKLVQQNMPILRYGSNSTNITQFGVQSVNNPLLQTIHMNNQGNTDPNQKTPGADTGATPMLVLPVKIELETLGCPALQFGQSFYLDAGTGTSVDNIYHVTSLKHSLQPGKFKSSISMSPSDAWGRFRGLLATIESALDFLDPTGDATVEADLEG